MVDALYGLLGRLGFDHPLHSLLVHMPIGLVVGALTFFLVAVIFRRKGLVPTARNASILAFVFVFPTILTGVFDWLHFYHGVLAQPIKMKMILAAAVTVLLGVGIVLGSGIRVRTPTMMVLYALAFVGVVGLGYFGGTLVYGGSSAGGTQVLNAAGQKVFADQCLSCHRDGGNAVRADRPLKKSRLLEDRTQFVAFLRAPTGDMPPFAAADVSDAQAGDLFEYLSAMRSVWN